MTIDDKGRVPLPAKLVGPFRELCGCKSEEDAPDVVITMDISGRVAIFPKMVYEGKVKQLEEKGDPNSRKLAKFLENYADEQTLDKASRFRVPQLLASHRRLERDVVVYGSGNYLEIVNKVDWEEGLKVELAGLQELCKLAGV